MFACSNFVITILLCITVSPAATKQKVFYGEAELVQQLLTNPTQWSYVQQNADGFYVNFIQMDHMMTPADLKGFYNLYQSGAAYFESDCEADHQTGPQDKAAIDALHTAGFKIIYTSLNYGWSAERDQILGYYNLTEPISRRPDFTQLGPWCLSGNINNDPGTGPFPNSKYREWIVQSDGLSTDGPMGYWSINFEQMQEGSYSSVQFAHSVNKTAAVMLCPYGAGISTYNSVRDFLTVGISCVHGHEDNDADPDIWIIFEYADATIQAVPEQINGYPANTTTGMAYYVLKHRDGEPETLDLYMHENMTGKHVYVPQALRPDLVVNVPVGVVVNHTVHIADYSDWLDYAASIRANITGGSKSGWNIIYTLNGVDISHAMNSPNGFIFLREHRVRPGTVQSIDISITSTSAITENAILNIQLAPHRGSAVVDSVQIFLTKA